MADTFRQVYTPLTDEQKKEMLAVKEKAEELEGLFLKSLNAGADARLIAVAKTDLEKTILVAVKAITNVRG